MPNDLKKLKLFSWAGDPKNTEVWKSLGFDPRRPPSTELPTGLQTGLFEAFLSSPQVSVVSRFYENAKFMTDLKWQLLLGATVIHKETWAQIPADLRPALLQATQEAGTKLQVDPRERREGRRGHEEDGADGGAGGCEGQGTVAAGGRERLRQDRRCPRPRRNTIRARIPTSRWPGAT